MSLIIGGRDARCSVTVLDWHQTGLHYEVGESRGVTPRTGLIDTVVWHWTAAENSPEKMFANLRRRRLAVEYAIHRDGTVYQFADPHLADCHDCGRRWDRRSVGVELVNYGMRWPASKPWNLRGIPKGGRDRPLVRTTLRGRDVYVAAFTAAQMTSAVALGRALSDSLPVPWAFATPRYLGLSTAPDADRILDGPLHPWQARRWQGGNIGHQQITSRGKSDPGLPFLQSLRAAGPGA